MKRNYDDAICDIQEDITHKTARLAHNTLILEHLQKRNSGVTVTKHNVSIEDINQSSIFEVLSLFEGKSKRYLKAATEQKKVLYSFRVDSRHLEILKESRDLPDEESLCEIERLFNVCLNVYILELFEGTFHTNLFRTKDGARDLNVVYLAGRFFYINDLQKFVVKPSLNESNLGDKPRLKWIKDHKHIQTLTKNTRGTPYTDSLNFFRCLAAHYHSKNVTLLAQHLYRTFQESLSDRERATVIGDPTYRNDGESITPRNIFREIDDLEKLFSIKINIYRLGACDGHNSQQKEDYPEAKICPSIVRLSISDHFTDTIHLLVYEDHFCYISDITKLSQHVVCVKCNKACTSRAFSTHFRRCRGAKTTTTFNHKTYSVPRTLAEECDLHGIKLDPLLQFPEFVLTWDIETYTPDSRDERSTHCDVGEPIPIILEGDDDDELDELNVQALTELLDECEEKKHIDKTNTLTGLSNTQFASPHTLLSIGCATNVPGYDKETKVFISQGDSQDLVEQFMNYVGEVQIAAGKEIATLVSSTVKQILHLEEKESSDLWKKLDTALYERQKERIQTANEVNDGGDDSVLDGDNDGSDDESDLAPNILDFDESGLDVEKDPGEPEEVIGARLPPRSSRSVSTLVGRLVAQCRQLSVVGFNSGSFDSNVISNYLLPYFNASPDVRKECTPNDDILHRLFFPRKKKEGQDNNDSDGWDKKSETPSIIKKGSKYLLLSNARFKFIDIINFCPPGTSYASYLRGYKAEDSKLPFPYDWMTSLDLLDYPDLPPKEAFYNSLKQSHITDEEYEKAQQLWTDCGMQTFRDYLIAYNSNDCRPFVTCLTRQKAYFREKGVHLFDYVSIPGVAEKLLHKNAPPGTWFSTLSKKDEDLYEQFNNALQGGPSIIFHRHSVAGESLIRPKEDIKPDHQTVQKIVGLGKLKKKFYVYCGVMVLTLLLFKKNICAFFFMVEGLVFLCVKFTTCVLLLLFIVYIYCSSFFVLCKKCVCAPFVCALLLCFIFFFTSSSPFTR